MSPGETEHLEKSIEDVFMRGGVPVFSLDDEKPRECKDSVMPRLCFSPILPALVFCSPTCMSPFRKVPQVIIRARQNSFSPDSKTTPETPPPDVFIFTTSPRKTDKPSDKETLRNTSCSYFLLSIWALGDHTALPLDLFSIIY